MKRDVNFTMNNIKQIRHAFLSRKHRYTLSTELELVVSSVTLRPSYITLQEILLLTSTLMINKHQFPFIFT